MKYEASKKVFSRRSFIAQMGAAAAALSLSQLTRSRAARADSPVAPLRLITMHYPWHVPEIFYHPKDTSGGFAPGGTSFNLQFPNSVLSPLAPFQSKLLVFRGLAYGQGPIAHASNASCFTGAIAANCTGATPATTTGSSIEQYLFTRMAHAGSLDPIVAGLMTYSPQATYSQNGFGWCTSWRAGNAQLAIDDPQKLFSAYFGNFRNPGSDNPAADAILARRNKTLAIAQHGLAGLLAQLPASSRSTPILQQHQGALKGVIAALNANPSTSASCSAPAAINADPGPDSGAIDFTKAQADFASFSTMVTEAFACDITRFASIKLSASDDALLDILSTIPALASYNGGNWHNNVSHPSTGTGDASDVWMALSANYWHQLLANLMTQLQATSDPYSPSQSLLDNTVILMACEGPILTPNGDVHNDGHEDQPFIVAGGCGGMFKMGQLIDARPLGTVMSTNPPDTRSTKGIAHNALLTNLVNAFEANQAAFNPGFTPKILTRFGDYDFPVSATTWLS